METAVSKANKRNQIGKLRTNCELARLNRAEKLDRRMQDNSIRLRFRSSFLKYNKEGAAALSSAKVKMYDTHTPGFCYKHNGQWKTSQDTVAKPSAISLKSVQELLFTDGEVDVDKILCLHLLTTHTKVESSSTDLAECGPAGRPSSCKSMSRNSTRQFEVIQEQQALRLANTRQRAGTSKLKKQAKPADSVPPTSDVYKHAKELPTYILEFRDDRQDFESTGFPSSVDFDLDRESNKSIKQSRTKKILVNEKILKLVNSVLKGLERANPAKMKAVLDTGRNPTALKDMIRKPRIQKFIYALNDKLFLLRSDSFRVMDAERVPIYLNCEPSTNLERLVSDIRESAIQPANRYHSWRLQSSNTQVSSFSAQKISMLSKHSIRNVDSSFAMAKNSKTNISEHSIASYLSKKFREARQKDMDELKDEQRRAKVIEEEEKCQEMRNTSPGAPELRPEQVAAATAKPFSVRRSACVACLQRFQTPRVSPKGRSLRRHNQDVDSSLMFFKNISHASTGLLTRLLQNAAENQKNRFNVAGVRRFNPRQSWDSVSTDEGVLFRNPSVFSDVYSISKCSSPLKIDHVSNNQELVFTPENLEKIQQEVALKETHKRLEKFLNAPPI